MSIKLQQLKHFVMVVEEGGFRAASHRANRSQAALSTSIKELEKTSVKRCLKRAINLNSRPLVKSAYPRSSSFLISITH